MKNNPKEEALDILKSLVSVTDCHDTVDCAVILVKKMKEASKRITNHLPKSWCGTEQEYYDKVIEHIKSLDI